MVHVQVIPVKGMGLMSRSAASSGDVFVASSSGDAGVVRLAPLPFAQQAKALADRNELSAALEMAALVPSTQVCSQPVGGERQEDGSFAGQDEARYCIVYGCCPCLGHIVMYSGHHCVWSGSFLYSSLDEPLNVKWAISMLKTHLHVHAQLTAMLYCAGRREEESQ